MSDLLQPLSIDPKIEAEATSTLESIERHAGKRDLRFSCSPKDSSAATATQNLFL
jgi:hypothetical protein